ncbi:MAG: DUF1566 domain-containing protein [Labilithrix sp.]|nr:DUF1566 domain-containing protein [Labilithrix sp.]
MKRLLPRLVLGALAIAMPAAAAAPRDPPQYKFFDKDDPTIKDNFTLLEWDRRALITDATWAVADTSCSFLFGNTGRLPTIKELLTILDEDPHEKFEFGKIVFKMIDQDAFDGAQGTPVDLPYWTSTPAPDGKLWTLDFSTGAMVPKLATEKGNARCVR